MFRRTSLILLMTLSFSGSFAPSPGQSPSPSLGVLDSAGWSHLVNQGRYIGLQLALLTLRIQPSLLEEKKLMQYFILVNNCSGPNFTRVSRGLNNELEYPDMANFYKPRAEEILKVVPSTFSIEYQYVNWSIAGQPPGPSPIYLGEYDLARKVFPFVDRTGKKMTVAIADASPGDSDAMCGITTGFSFDVRFPPVKFTEIAMSEGNAKSYLQSPRVGQPGLGRQVDIAINLEVLPDAPKIAPNPRIPNQRFVTLASKVNKVTVINPYSNRTLGDLYP